MWDAVYLHSVPRTWLSVTSVCGFSSEEAWFPGIHVSLPTVLPPLLSGSLSVLRLSGQEDVGRGRKSIFEMYRAGC